MDDFSDGVMIALLPTESHWSHADLPHLTLVYAGTVDELKPSDHNDLAKTAISLAFACPSLKLRVLGPDVFGEEEKVDVLRVESTPELLAMRHQVRFWNASEHPFNPHVTLGPVGTVDKVVVPSVIEFDAIAVAWGDDLLTYWLR